MDRRSVGLRIGGPMLSWLLVAAGCAAYCGAMLRLVLWRYDHFGMSAFDLGIFDQAVWLISQGTVPFSTLRGTHILGDHFSIVIYLLAPMYRLAPDPRTLLLLQTVGISVAALPLFRLACRLLASRWLALSLSCAYLMSPAVQWLNASDFHPECFAPVLLLAAFWSLSERRWAAFATLLLLTATLKETAGLTICGLGLMLARRSRLAAAGATLGGLAAIVMAMLVVRAFGDGGPNPYLALLTAPGSAFAGSEHSSGCGWSSPPAADAIAYVHSVVYPLLYVPVGAPLVLASAAPALLLNLAYPQPAARLMMGQYLAFVIPILFAATAHALAWVRNVLGRGIAAVMAVCLVLNAAVNYGSGPFAWRFDALDAGQSATVRRALACIPRDSAVSAQGGLVPYLSRRTEVYAFPNPFVRVAWGASTLALRQQSGLDVPHPAVRDLVRRFRAVNVEWVALCPAVTAFPCPSDRKLYYSSCVALLVSGRYAPVEVTGSTVILRRLPAARRTVDGVQWRRVL